MIHQMCEKHHVFSHSSFFIDGRMIIFISGEAWHSVHADVTIFAYVFFNYKFKFLTFFL